MRLAVFSGNEYQSVGGRLFADRAFVLFLAALAGELGGVRLLGRISEGSDRARYELSPQITFVPLKSYSSLGRPLVAMAATIRSFRTAWRSLDEVDTVWALGPHPVGLMLVLIGLMRRRRVVLGVRQETISYVRSRHPGRRALIALGVALELTWRALARVLPTVVVGPELAEIYRRSPRMHELIVSLVSERELEAPAAGEPDSGEVTRLISVGRIETEKNPLLLADVLEILERDEPGRWTLSVCGEGPLTAALGERLEHNGVLSRATLEGYVPFAELAERYRAADVFVATSWTEGFPQTFVEAFAAGLPVVSTDVGGIRRAAEDAVVLVPAGDAQALADGLRRVRDDGSERERLRRAGAGWIRAHTLEREVDGLLGFLAR
ncbi:glycosyltransferase [Thermoleophilia bacterium SCSIO 60948]|nr:glycosyltransferase [Thermoleophilia bacterium SCSIO 60948]